MKHLPIFFKVVKSRKMKPQAKIHNNFAILLLKGYLGREKISFHEKNLKYGKIILLIKFIFVPNFFLSLLTKFKKIMRF